jgi:precorrin-6x reductase
LCAPRRNTARRSFPAARRARAKRQVGETGDYYAAARRGPRLVVDATHPYAEKISQNLREACAAEKIRYVRLLREETESDGCLSFSGWDELTDWLNRTEGMIFAATGAKAARDLTRVKDFAARVYLRMLPSPEGIAACLALGYPMGHLICLQGPVSEELNRALFGRRARRFSLRRSPAKPEAFPKSSPRRRPAA